MKKQVWVRTGYLVVNRNGTLPVLNIQLPLFYEPLPAKVWAGMVEPANKEMIPVKLTIEVLKK